jgi:hypothetical protein
MATPTGLNVSDVVNVQVNISPIAATFSNFGSLVIIGSTPNVIDTTERIRLYTTLAGVASDFGTSVPEYLAAVLFFGQSPQPAFLYIGRWAQFATSGVLHGGFMTPTMQLLSNFTSISNGGFIVFVDGVPCSLTGIGLTGALNLNGVAALIQTELQTLATGATFTWNSTLQRFDIISGTSGATSSVSVAAPPTASGWINFAANPSPSATVTINGTAVTFVTSGPTGNQVVIGGTTAITMANLVAFANASTDVNISKVTLSVPNVVGTKVYVVSKVTGSAGNAYTLAASAATVSAATLTGGTGTDLSILTNTELGFSSAPVIGVAAETALSAISTLDNLSGVWYGAMFATSTPPADADYIACAGYIEAANRAHIFGVTSQEPGILDPTNNSDIASSLKVLTYKRTFVEYSSSSLYAGASIFGRAFTVNFNAQNSVITLKFKQEPGIVAEFLTESQAQTLTNKNCNVFVNYQNNTAIIQQGTMVNGFFFDEVHGTDWLSNAVQTNVYNLLYQSPTKIPQTDPGTHLIVNEINDTMAASVNNGLVAPGKWTGPAFGQLNTNDTLTIGYYVYAPPVATQAQADREARKSVPIQAAIKLAGAIHSVNVIMTVNR